MTVESERIANGIGRGMAVDLKDYFERLLQEHEKRHDRDHESDEEALGKAFDAVRLANQIDKTEVLRRLTELNNSHDLARQKEVTFISRDLHVKAIENLEEKIADRDKILAAIREELAGMRARNATWNAAIVFVFSVITVASRFL